MCVCVRGVRGVCGVCGVCVCVCVWCVLCVRCVWFVRCVVCVCVRCAWCVWCVVCGERARGVCVCGLCRVWCVCARVHVRVRVCARTRTSTPGAQDAARQTSSRSKQDEIRPHLERDLGTKKGEGDDNTQILGPCVERATLQRSHRGFRGTLSPLG